MAEDSLVVDFLVRKNEIFEETTKVDKSMRLLDETFNQVMKTNSAFDNSSKTSASSVKNFDDIIKGLDEDINAANKNMKAFDMRMLSVLFTGMALQRAFGGMLRGITNTFAKAEGDTSQLRESTNQLTASWEFFKFSLFDALGTDFFIGIIDGLASVVRWFGNLPEGARVAITATIAALALIGTGALIYAQISMAWLAIFSPVGLLATSAATTATSVAVSTTAINTSLGTVVLAVSGALAALALLGLAGAAVVAGTKAFDGYDQDAISMNEMGIESIDNLAEAQDELTSAGGILTQEYSNINGGMDRTISLSTLLNTETGLLEGHIITTGEAIDGTLAPSIETLGINFDNLANSIRDAREEAELFNEIVDTSETSTKKTSSITRDI